MRTRPGRLARRHALLAAALLSGATAARADWTGTLHIQSEPAGPRGGTQEGRISGQGTKLRFDLAGPPQVGPMSMIFDMKAKTSIVVVEQRKAFMRRRLDGEGGNPGARPGVGGQATPVLCDTDDAAECLRKNGFSRTGSETVNGVKADKWEKDKAAHDEKAAIHETMWIPQGVKDFALVKQVTRRGDHTTTLDVLDFKKASLPAAQFEAPAGYTEMQGPGALMGPMGGRPGAATNPVEKPAPQ